jgi:hypothetical protein
MMLSTSSPRQDSGPPAARLQAGWCVTSSARPLDAELFWVTCRNHDSTVEEGVWGQVPFAGLKCAARGCDKGRGKAGSGCDRQQYVHAEKQKHSFGTTDSNGDPCMARRLQRHAPAVSSTC